MPKGSRLVDMVVGTEVLLINAVRIPMPIKDNQVNPFRSQCSTCNENGGKT